MTVIVLLSYEKSQFISQINVLKKDNEALMELIQEKNKSISDKEKVAKGEYCAAALPAGRALLCGGGGKPVWGVLRGGSGTADA